LSEAVSAPVIETDITADLTKDFHFIINRWRVLQNVFFFTNNFNEEADYVG
jgi:hypothetical protein